MDVPKQKAKKQLEEDIELVTGFVGGVGLIKGAGKVVIGENMTERVIPYAKEIGAKWYKPRSTNPANWMKKDERWIREQVKKGRGIIDIGIDATRAARSKYYEMEKRILEELGYPVTKP